MELRVEGTGCGFEGVGFGVGGEGCRDRGLGLRCRFLSFGFRWSGLGMSVELAGLRVQGAPSRLTTARAFFVCAQSPLFPRHVRHEKANEDPHRLTSTHATGWVASRLYEPTPCSPTWFVVQS